MPTGRTDCRVIYDCPQFTVATLRSWPLWAAGVKRRGGARCFWVCLGLLYLSFVVDLSSQIPRPRRAAYVVPPPEEVASWMRDAYAAQDPFGPAVVG